MKKSIIVFVTLFIFSVASLAQGRTAIGEMDSDQEFRIDTALIVKMRKVATTVGPTMIRFADSIAALHGGKVTPINYKSFQSTLRKCNTQKVQATELNDLVRCMIACPYDSLHSMITDLVRTAKKKGMFKKYRHQAYLDRGYWGDMVILNHGVIGSEIQVKSFYMAYANFDGNIVDFLGEDICAQIKNNTGEESGMSHHYYEIIRDISGRYTEEEKMRAADENTRYLRNFWEDYKKGVTFY
jgi:hypothetical protein